MPAQTPFSKNLVAAMLLFASLTAGATCTRPSDFNVDALTLEKVSVAKAFSALGDQAGFRVDYRGTSKVLFSSKDAGGPLDALLDYVAGQTGSVWRIDQRACSLMVYDTEAAPKEDFYILSEGEPIHTELQRWAIAGGWKKFSWTLPYSWRVFSDTTFKEESAFKAIAKVIEYLREEGKPVRMTVFEGNGVLEVVSGELTN